MMDHHAPRAAPDPGVPDPRDARVLTEDEVDALTSAEHDEFLVQSAKGWVFVLTRAGGQGFLVPDPDLVRDAAARIAARAAGGLDQDEGPPPRELPHAVAEAIRDSAEG